MNIKTSSKDYIWSFFAYFLKFGVNIFLLPLVLKLLSKQEYGLWVTFSSISVLVNLFDFGFSSSILRYLTYVWSGAKKLQKNGICDTTENGVRDDRLFVLTYCASKTIYKLIAILAFGVSVVLGTLYVLYIIREMFSVTYLIAWIIYAVNISLNLMYCYCTVSLKAIGAISQSQKAIIIGFLIQFAISCLGLLFGVGIIALSLAGCVGGVTTRLISGYYFKREGDMLGILTKYKTSISRNEISKILRIVWYNAKKAGVSSIATVIMTQGTTLLCSAFIGVETTALYGICLQLLSALSGVAQIFYQTSIPKLTQTIQTRETNESRELLSASLLFAWIVFISGFIVLSLCGNNILTILGSNISIDIRIFLLMSIYTFGEMNYSMNSSYISLSNILPFVKSVIITSSVCIISSIICLSYVHSIYLLLAIRIITEGIYIFWKWPLFVQRLIDLNTAGIIKYGFNYFVAILLNK